MVNRSKNKGTMAETAVVSFLRTVGFPYAERLALQGSKDRGDITGIPGIVIEVKNEKVYTWSSWLREASVEKTNAAADHGLVVAKPRSVGTTRVDMWWAGMYAGDFRALREQAGLPPSQVWIQAIPGTAINRDLGPAMTRLPGMACVGQYVCGVVEISTKGVGGGR